MSWTIKVPTFDPSAEGESDYLKRAEAEGLRQVMQHIHQQRQSPVACDMCGDERAPCLTEQGDTVRCDACLDAEAERLHDANDGAMP